MKVIADDENTSEMKHYCMHKSLSQRNEKRMEKNTAKSLPREKVMISVFKKS